MGSFLARWLATAVAAGVAVWLVPGIDTFGAAEAWQSIAIFGLVLAFVNAILKPIAQVLSLPITILTLGIFYLIVNTAMIYLAAWFAESIFGAGIAIASFGSAFVASIIISIVSAIANSVIGSDA